MAKRLHRQLTVFADSAILQPMTVTLQTGFDLLRVCPRGQLPTDARRRTTLFQPPQAHCGERHR
jgi:hypothetical protein